LKFELFLKLGTSAIWRSAVALIDSTVSEKDIAASKYASLQKEAKYFREILAQFFQPTTCPIPEARNHSVRRHESLKYNRWFLF
jgi:hypothetical protein